MSVLNLQAVGASMHVSHMMYRLGITPMRSRRTHARCVCTWSDIVRSRLAFDGESSQTLAFAWHGSETTFCDQSLASRETRCRRLERLRRCSLFGERSMGDSSRCSSNIFQTRARLHALLPCCRNWRRSTPTLTRSTTGPWLAAWGRIRALRASTVEWPVPGEFGATEEEDEASMGHAGSVPWHPMPPNAKGGDKGPGSVRPHQGWNLVGMEKPRVETAPRPGRADRDSARPRYPVPGKGKSSGKGYSRGIAGSTGTLGTSRRNASRLVAWGSE